MSRNVKLIVSLFALLFLGLIYGWSIFVGPLEAEFGWERASTSLTFTISVIANVALGFVGTSLRDRVPGGARTCIVIGAAMICCGFVCASLWPSLGGFYLFYGVLCGGGIGLAYMAILGFVPGIFPDRLGLVSGMLAMAYGLGALVLGTVCSQLLDMLGWRATFRAIGLVFAAILVLTAAVLGETGGSGSSPSPAPTMTLGQVLRDRRTWGTLLWCLLPTTAGLSVTGQIVPCATALGIPAATAVLVAGGVSLGNGIGRVLFGELADRLDLHRSMPIANALFVAGAALSTAGVVLGATAPFIAGAFLLGVSFGSAPTTTVFSAKRFFGVENYALALGFLNLQVVVASVVGPWVSGVLYSETGSYVPMFAEICLLAAASLAVLAWHLRNVRAATE
ncbi:MAG: MFS transporter [Atopobiaceae bacterium]|nr:MFS transporter [Atopobiaceae bacterium]